MTIIENGKIHNVTLRTWSNKENGWEFGGTDSSDDVMQDPGVLAWNDDAEAYELIDGETFAEWFAWWNEQCELYNNRDEGSWFVEGFDQDELDAEWAKDLEMVLAEI
jgi:hypothetical protein